MDTSPIPNLLGHPDIEAQISRLESVILSMEALDLGEMGKCIHALLVDSLMAMKLLTRPGLDLVETSLHVRNVFELHLILRQLWRNKRAVKKWYGQSASDMLDFFEPYRNLMERFGIEVAEADQVIADIKRIVAESPYALRKSSRFNLRDFAVKFGYELDYDFLYTFTSKMVHPSAIRVISKRMGNDDGDAYEKMLMHVGAVFCIETVSFAEPMVFAGEPKETEQKTATPELLEDTNDAVYALRTFASDSPGDFKITSEEFDKIRVAHDGLIELTFMEEKLDWLVESYIEFEEELLRLGLRHMVLWEYKTYNRNKTTLDRRLLNLLTAARTYVDHSKHHISSIYGRDSLQYQLLEEQFTQYFERDLSYRMLEKLRNYVQHRGYPSDMISYQSKKIEAEEGYKLRHQVVPKLNCLELESDRNKFGAKVLDDMKQLGNNIDLRPHVRKYLDNLCQVQATVRDYIKDDICDWEYVLKSAKQRYADHFPQKSSTVGIHAINLDDDGNILEKVPFSGVFLDWRAELAEKNSILGTLDSKYVSGEIDEGLG